MKILVFGRNGQVARALARGAGPDWVFAGSEEADFRRSADVLSALDRHRPETVVIASAYTKVDLAETNVEEAFQVNAKAPGAIGSWARNHGARVVHFSSDYVYGDVPADRPHFESDPIRPLNVYGRSKAEGDQALLESCAAVTILRTSWVYHDVGQNFVRTMLRLGAERESLRVVSDQHGAPTSAEELAAVVHDVIERGPSAPTGVFHCCGEGETTWADFAREIFRQWSARGKPLKVKEVRGIPSSEYPTPARRPLNSRLNLAHFRAELGLRTVPWETALERVLERMANDPTV